MEQEVGRFQTEIILFVILAACVILMASNFGAGGFVGDAISNFCCLLYTSPSPRD